MKSSSPQAQKQRGMAIISALLIAAVVAVIAAGMLTRQSVFTRSLEAEQSRVQGAAALLAGLELSRQVLRDTRQQDVLTRLDQPWAQPVKSHLLNSPGAVSRGASRISRASSICAIYSAMSASMADSCAASNASAK